ncbi:MAG: class I SAM-dependent methyltransferase [Candidatus Electrothrix scaldis]|nr:MAG: class I SAM-dependent methyltransferase [Candidatus Electrothrix sp. GW3-3]
MVRNGNIDQATVTSFSDEWSRFDQTGMTEGETRKVFDEYFAVFPWSNLPTKPEGFDMGCGSGRWARLVAPRVRLLHCIDPSEAIEVARRNLAEHKNVRFHRGTVDKPNISPNSQDFGYSLGVLHHVPDTATAIRSCVELLKPGAPLLLYLYYAFDNRPWWFRLIWRISDLGRRFIFRLPTRIKQFFTDIIAILLYWPLAKMSLLADRCGLQVGSIPLSYYRHHSLYTMRTDARDRFGTPLEQRFTQQKISTMMQNAGLVDIQFSDNAPFWCAVGRRKE